MPPEWTEVKEWLRKADHDRRMAEVALAQTPPITDGAAFHCQQAVEKLLKSFLVFQACGFEKIHDLRSLALECAAHDPEFGALEGAVAPLTAFAVRFRYPGLADPPVEEVRAALAVVEDVRRFVTGRLPPEVVPADEV
jgi:HEPN domain-containing protein